MNKREHNIATDCMVHYPPIPFSTAHTYHAKGALRPQSSLSICILCRSKIAMQFEIASMAPFAWIAKTTARRWKKEWHVCTCGDDIEICTIAHVNRLPFAMALLVNFDVMRLLLAVVRRGICKHFYFFFFASLAWFASPSPLPTAYSQSLIFIYGFFPP